MHVINSQRLFALYFSTFFCWVLYSRSRSPPDTPVRDEEANSSGCGPLPWQWACADIRQSCHTVLHPTSCWMSDVNYEVERKHTHKEIWGKNVYMLRGHNSNFRESQAQPAWSKITWDISTVTYTCNDCYNLNIKLVLSSIFFIFSNFLFKKYKMN